MKLGVNQAGLAALGKTDTAPIVLYLICWIPVLSHIVCSLFPKLVSRDPDIAGLTVSVPLIVDVPVQVGPVAWTSNVYTVGTAIVTEGVPEIVNKAGGTVNCWIIVIPVPSVFKIVVKGPTATAEIVKIGSAYTALYLGLALISVANTAPIWAVVDPTPAFTVWVSPGPLRLITKEPATPAGPPPNVIWVSWFWVVSVPLTPLGRFVPAGTNCIPNAGFDTVNWISIIGSKAQRPFWLSVVGVTTDTTGAGFTVIDPLNIASLHPLILFVVDTV